MGGSGVRGQLGERDPRDSQVYAEIPGDVSCVLRFYYMGLFFFLPLLWKQSDFSQLHSAPRSRSIMLPQTRRPVHEFREQAHRGWGPVRDS